MDLSEVAAARRPASFPPRGEEKEKAEAVAAVSHCEKD
jgi:hypothetical protein